mgnify:CR=1 FL=1
MEIKYQHSYFRHVQRIQSYFFNQFPMDFTPKRLENSETKHLLNLKFFRTNMISENFEANKSHSDTTFELKKFAFKSHLIT